MNKGFTFEIKNNLLEPKHIEAMGISIWLFMWLDDKITKIDENEVGWVLGGKPIKYEQVQEELGISQATYTRWIAQLSKYPYIKAIRTPYGISFRVYKAHKNFKKRLIKSEESSSSKVRNHVYKSEESNKTITVDNNSKTKEVELPIWINKNAWENWLKYNKERKKKMPPTTISFQIKKLERFKNDHVEMINQSIEKGWSGLFPVKKTFENSDARRVIEKRREGIQEEEERKILAGDEESRKKINEDIKKLHLGMTKAI